MIQSAKHAFRDVPAEVEIRNEARVHLWYQKKFGTPCQVGKASRQSCVDYSM